jgi:hypothetical protein
MKEESAWDTRRRLRMMAAVYFGSFLVWFLIGFIRGGCAWRTLLAPVQWMITGWMILLFPCGLPGLFIDAAKVSVWLLAAGGYAIYAALTAVMVRAKQVETFRLLMPVFVCVVLLNHAGCVRVWHGATSHMTLP